MKIPPPSPATKTSPSLRPALAALCATAAFLAGCATEPESHLVSAPPPPAPNTAVIITPAVTTTQTTQTTQTTPTGTVVITQLAPPAMPAEIVTARPSSDYGWVAGSWTWRNNRYEWLAGRWEKPPYSGARWNASRWESENGAYRFYEGYWN